MCRERIFCLNCNKVFLDYKRLIRKFCSKTCATTYNNLQRDKSIYEKQSLTLKNTLIDKGFLVKIPKKPKEKIYRKPKLLGCKFCSSITEGKKQICEICRYNYYSTYRFSTKFSFSIKKYSFLFSEESLKILKDKGFYAASNRKNNIEGVSRDHRYSVSEGFKNNIPSFIMNHPANCDLLPHKENQRKHAKSNITYKELLLKILEVEKRIETLDLEKLAYINERLAELA